MNHQEQTVKQSGNDQHKTANQIHLPAWLWVLIGAIGFIVAGILYLVVVGLGLFVLSRYLGANTDPINFIITNLLSALIFAAVVIQAAIYFVQWRAMRDTLKQGRDALEISERAYVGVRAVLLKLSAKPDLSHSEKQDIILTIENVGKLPADGIYVKADVISLVPESVQTKYPNSLKGSYHYDWPWDFKTTKLFRGNVNFEILIPFADEVNLILWSQIRRGNARVIAQFQIDYADGFGRPQRSDYAFRLESGKWMPWWAWTTDDMEGRIAEEISRYPQYKTCEEEAAPN
jgi:hypothetical protein